MRRLERSSELRAEPDRAWARATDFAAINDELRPLVRMTMPERLRGLPLDQFPVGAPAGRSWILLFGLLPVDYDDLWIAELEPPRRFLERSRTLTFAIWEHERSIEPLADGGCRLIDRLGFTLRRPLSSIPGAEGLAAMIVGAPFRHRHRRLRQRDAGGA